MAWKAVACWRMKMVHNQFKRMVRGMKKKTIAVLTDSACDIPPQLEKESGVDILPFQITVDGKSYWERVDFTAEEYYKMLETCENIPATAHITSLRFAEKFKEYDDAGIKQVLYVSINSTGSNTYYAAQMGVQEFREERKDSKMEIWVVDSHTYSAPFGWFVAEAAFKLKNGAEMCDVVQWLEDIFARMEVVLGAYSLRFLKKSGRVNAAAAFAGELLGLRPVFTLIDGESQVQKKVRGDKLVIPAMLEYMMAHCEEGSDYIIAGTNEEQIKEMSALCEKQFKKKPLCAVKLGAAVSTNTGPQALGLGYFGKKRDR